jgi:signal transduction histidine kinase
LAVLALVAALTNVATRFVSVYWAGIDCETNPAMQWLVVGGALVPTVLRRRLPTIALVMAAALFGWFPATAAAFALAAYSAVVRVRSRRRLVTASALAAVIPLGVALVGSRFQWESVFTAFGFGVVVCVMVPAMLGLLLEQRDRLVVALRQQTGYLRRNYELADSAARLQERSRIAGEMHDLLGHRLSLISLYAGALELDAARSVERASAAGPRGRLAFAGDDGREDAGVGAPDTDQADEARLIRETVATAMGELRRILGVLRGAGHDSSTVLPAETAGAKEDITDLVAQSQAAGVEVELVWSGADLLDAAPATRRAVHRIVREALTNIHRHATGASARVVVERDGERVRIEISNGVGSGGRRSDQPAGSGSGLVGVQERVRLLGGAFWAGPSSDGGFHLVADLPINPSPAGEPIGDHPLLVRGPARRAVVADPSIPAGRRAGAGRPAGHQAGRAGQRPGERWARAGMAAVLSTGLAGTIAIVNLAFGYVVFQPTSDERDPAELVKVGMPRSEVVQLVGDGNPFIGVAARGVEPARAPNAACIYQTYGPKLDTGGTPQPDAGQRTAAPTPTVWSFRRYCFVQDRLVDIDEFDVPEPTS